MLTAIGETIRNRIGLSARVPKSKHSLRWYAEHAGCFALRTRSDRVLCGFEMRLTQIAVATANSKLLVPVFLHRLLLLVLCIALDCCHSHKANSGPSIEFTHIPPAAEGGRERVDTISGRVRNARPKQQIVIYAHAGSWWVQPWPDHPFIPIKANSTWSTETH